jgi:hypothetical protein
MAVLEGIPGKNILFPLTVRIPGRKNDFLIVQSPPGHSRVYYPVSGI